jgi:hypothetical protein
MKARKSLRQSINEKWRECIYAPYAVGTWRKQVDECTSPSCPLYSVRPTAEYAPRPQEGRSLAIVDPKL